MDERSEAEAGTGEKTGAFTVSVRELVVVRPEKASLEDDLQTWTQTLVLIDGAPCQTVWHAGLSTRSSVTNTSLDGAPFNFARASRPVPLSAHALSRIARGVLLITVHQGTSRDPLSDRLCGFVTAPLSTLLQCDRDSAGVRKLPLQQPSSYPAGYPRVLAEVPDSLQPSPPPSQDAASRLPHGKSALDGALAVAVKADDALREFVVGGRVVTFRGVRLTPCPPSWGLDPSVCPLVPGSAVSSASPETVASLAAADPARYTLSLPLSFGSSDAAAAAAVVDVGTGVLSYVRVRGNDAPSAGEASAVLHAAATAAQDAPPASTGTTAPTALDARSVTSGKGAAKWAAPAKPAPGGAAASKQAAQAAAAAEAEAETARLKLAHSAYSYCVEWPPFSVFLPPTSVDELKDGLKQHSSSLTATVRRVLTAQIDASSDPSEGILGLAPDRRCVREDLTSIGTFELHLDPLIVPGIDAVVVSDASVSPCALAEDDKKRREAAQTERDAAWEAHLAKKEAAAAAATSAAAAAATGTSSKVGAAATGKAGTAAAAPAKPQGAAGGAKESAPSKGAPATKSKGSTEPPPAERPATASASASCVFKDTPATVSLQLSLHKPLVVAPPAPLESRVTDVVPSRRPVLSAPPRPDAVEAFRREVVKCADAVVAEYTSVDGAIGGAMQADSETKQHLAISQLVQSGMYNSVVDSLKISAQHLIKEHLLGLPGANDPPGSVSHDLFRTWVFEFLSDQINLAITRAMKTPREKPSSAVVSTLYRDIEALRKLALECEMDGRFSRAEQLLKERLIAAEDAAACGHLGNSFDADVWYDLAAFYLRRGLVEQARPCLHEAVSSNSAHVPALLAFAVVLSDTSETEQALVLATGAIASLTSEQYATGTDGASRAVAYGVAAIVQERAGFREQAGDSIYAAVAAMSSEGGSSEAGEATAGQAYLITARYLEALGLHSSAALAIQHASDAQTDSPEPVPTRLRVELIVLQARLYLGQLGFLAAAPVVNDRLPSYSSETTWEGKQPFSSLEACASALNRASDLDGECADVWWLLACTQSSSVAILSHERGPPSGCCQVRELDLHALIEAQRLLELATSSLSLAAAKLQIPTSIVKCRLFGYPSGMLMYRRYADVLTRLATLDVDAPGADEHTRGAVLSAAEQAVRMAGACDSPGDGAGPRLWERSLSIFCTDLSWPSLWVQHGVIKKAMGNVSEAEGSFLRAVKLDPRSPDAPAYLALLYLDDEHVHSSDRLAEARLYADHAISLGLTVDTCERAALIDRIVFGFTRRRLFEDSERIRLLTSPSDHRR